MNLEYENQRNTIQETILSQLDYSKDLTDEEVLEIIDSEIVKAAGSGGLFVCDMKKMRQEIYHSIRKLDVLQDLIDDPDITEIMINGPDNIFIEKNGMIQRSLLKFANADKLLAVISRIVGFSNRVVNEASPIVDARLPDGERVNVVLKPAAINGPILTIRRFPKEPIRMNDLITYGSITEELAGFLGKLTAAHYNIFISGGTGSGKTTFLNALSDHIPKDERVITIEDNAELQIRHIPNLVTLEARNANVDGCTPISIRDLIKTSLRMRPDRIIVGEVRGGEAIDMIQAMNTGHDGSMSTGHANGTADMLRRLETMVLMAMDLPIPAVRGQLESAIDIIIQLGRLRDKTRKLLEISEIDGFDDKGDIRLNCLYRFVETGEENGRIKGEWKKENALIHCDKLKTYGIRLT